MSVSFVHRTSVYLLRLRQCSTSCIGTAICLLKRLAAPYLLRRLTGSYLLRRLAASYLLRGLAASYLLRRLTAPYLLRRRYSLVIVSGPEVAFGNPQQYLKDKGVIDSGCSRHMIGNRSYLTDYKEIDGGFVAFGGNSKGGNITGKDFKLLDESHVLLKVPRNDNMYSVDLKRMFFLKEDETSEILKTFITGIENLIDLKVKVIRCDNGTEFKNRVMNQFCEMKGIKREFSVARTPQQNRAEAVNTACYVQNRVLVIKPHNKTPYELFLGRKPALSFMRPFGCPVTILNTIDHLGKFDGKADEGFFVGYSTNSKAFRVFNSRTRIVEENMHVQFSENTYNIAGSGPNWLFDIDALTNSMNYKPVVVGNQSNGNAGTKACDDAGKARVETVPGKDYILLPLWTQDLPFSSSLKNSPDARFKPSREEEKKDAKDPGNESGMKIQGMKVVTQVKRVKELIKKRMLMSTALTIIILCVDDLNMPYLEEIGRCSDAENDDSGADINILDTYFRVVQALKDPSWIEAMQEELLQFKLQEVWTLVELPNGKRAIGTKWVFKNKKDERGIVIKNKARLVAQGYKQEEGIHYDEVFAAIARIKAIRLFLAYASYKDFVVYQMDVKSAFLYGKIEKEVYVCQPLRFEDPDFPNRGKGDILLVQVYVDDIIFGSTKKSLCTEFEKMMHKKFQMSSIGELTFFLGLQVKQKKDGIFISQDKYVTEILKKFGFSDVKTTSTPMETYKPLLKYADGEDIDEHMYRSMIGSLMYFISSRPDIKFVVCVCARFQVNPKVSHLYAVKRIFRYLKGQPKLGIWYPMDSPFDLVAYTDSDYAGASLDRKSTTGGCQFLGYRLILW
ncbi:retrovirus-related pol polyprotein from transposon TNT 1-94 [Tanacetum coccineum]